MPSASRPARLLLLGGLWLFGLAACAGKPSTEDRPVLFASIDPLAGLVEAVAGDGFEVDVLVGPGESPVTYEPTSRQLTRLARASSLFTVGVPFEWSLVPRVRAQFSGLEVVPLGAEAEAPSPDGTHAHTGIDPHVWLDPLQTVEMVVIVAETLAAAHPEQADAFRARASDLVSRLHDQHERHRESLAPYQGVLLLTYHPAYGHFAARYGLEQRAIEEDGREPGPRHLAEVLSIARERRAEVLFVQPQHPRRSADAVARELGIEAVVVDPLQRDVFAVWSQLVAAILASPPEAPR